MLTSRILSKAIYTLAAFLVFGCGKRAVETFGDPVSLKELSSLAELIQAGSATQEDVLVQAEVKEVCQKKGCWMMVVSGDTEVRVTFKDYGFFVPKDCAGKVVRMQGRLVEKTLTESEARHFAEDAGKPESEIQNIVGEQETLEFVASGVELI